MFEAHGFDAINHRCWNEAMSVQDRLTPVPPRPTAAAAAIARLRAAIAPPRWRPRPFGGAPHPLPAGGAQPATGMR